MESPGFYLHNAYSMNAMGVRHEMAFPAQLITFHIHYNESHATTITPSLHIMVSVDSLSIFYV